MASASSERTFSALRRFKNSAKNHHEAGSSEQLPTYALSRSCKSIADGFFAPSTLIRIHLKRKFVSPVRPTIHTSNDVFGHRRRSISKTVSGVDTDLKTLTCGRPIDRKRSISKTLALIQFIRISVDGEDIGNGTKTIVWMGNMLSVFGAKTPFSNLSGVV